MSDSASRPLKEVRDLVWSCINPSILTAPRSAVSESAAALANALADSLAVSSVAT
jgi:hypothetical protein